MLIDSMITVDEPEHRRLRNLVHKGFTPRRLVALEGRIEEITHQLLDKAEANGRMELLEEFARPIPVTVIAEMVGVEVEEVPKLSYIIGRVLTLTLDQLFHKFDPFRHVPKHRFSNP